MDNVSLLQDTRNNKNLLRVAMEIAGKGTKEGDEYGVISQEAVPPPSRKPPVVDEDLDFAIESVINSLIED